MPNIQVRSSGFSKESTAEIEARGDVKIRLCVVIPIGAVILALAVGGVAISYCKDPQRAKDYWVIIAPIISSTIIGGLGFLAGERQGMKKRKS